MKVIIFFALFAAINLDDVSTIDISVAAQLPALDDLADSFEIFAEVISGVADSISESGDTYALLDNLQEKISAYQGLNDAVNELNAIVSSGAPLSVVNSGFGNLAQAVSELAATQGQGQGGSFADLSYFVSVKENVAVATSGTIALIDSLPKVLAGAVGQASILYGSVSSLNTLANAQSKLAATVNALADNSIEGSVLKSFASVTYQESSAEFDLAAAFVNAAINALF